MSDEQQPSKRPREPSDEPPAKRAAPSSPAAGEIRGDGVSAAGAAGRLWAAYSGGMIGLLCEVGYRTGLFRAACDAAGDGWLAPAELAAAAKCQERMTREWLSAMTCARLFEHRDAGEDAAGPGTFRALPGVREMCETQGESALVWSQMLSACAENMDRTVRAFREGGGVGAEHQGRFFRVLDDSHRESKGYAAVVDRLVLQADPAVERRLAAGEPLDVLELGCGGGLALCLLAERHPKARFVGCDLDEASVERARKTAAGRGLENVRFDCQDLGKYRMDGASFDLVFANDVVHDLPHPLPVLQAVRRCLRPGAPFVAVDIPGRSRLADNEYTDMNAMWYGVSVFHCLSIALAAGGKGLGTMWGQERALALLGEAGFDARHLEDVKDAAVYVCRAKADDGAAAAAAAPGTLNA